MNPPPQGQNGLQRLFVPYLRLPSGIWALFAAILVNRMGNFVAPFLTLYLTQKAGYTPAQTGFFVMLLPLAVIPALMGGGWLADRWGRRRVLVVGQALAGLVYVLASLAPQGPQVPALMVVATFLASVAQVGHNAMLNDLTTSDNRKTAFSLNYLGINLGFSIGPLAAGFLFSSNLGLFFLVDGLTTWGSAALVWFLTKETLGQPGAPGPRHPGEAREEGTLVQALARRPYFVAFLGIGLLGSAVYSQHTFSLPLQLARDFGPDGPAVYGAMMAVNALTVVVTSTLLTRLTAKFASLAVVAGASVLYALGFGLVGLIGWLPGPALAWFTLSTVVWSFGEILASVASHVYGASHTPENHRGRFSSLKMVANNGAAAVTAALTGLFIGGMGIGAVWPAVAAVSLISAVALGWLHHREGRSLRKSGCP